MLNRKRKLQAVYSKKYMIIFLYNGNTVFLHFEWL